MTRRGTNALGDRVKLDALLPGEAVLCAAPELPGCCGDDGTAESRAPRSDGDAARAPGRQPLRVLWIDDELRPDDPLLRLLVYEGIFIDVAGSGVEGLTTALSNTYNAILLDLKLPDMFGLTVLQRLMASQVRAPVAIVTGYYLQPEIQIDARRLGAATVLHKPFFDAGVLSTVIKVLVDGDRSGNGPVIRGPTFGIVAASQAMHNVIAWVERIAPSSVTVLLTGETGTGKELVARAIHHASGRRDAPFVPVNCGAVPEHLFDSELFGHRRGAFTGAVEDTTGLIEAAHRGTLFLDEIADIPLPMQVRLLRCLDDGRVRRVGESRERSLDVRVIAATNRSLHGEVARRRFRQDLYFRLSGASCEIPPLRERPEDVEALIRFWLPRLSSQDGKRSAGIDAAAMGVLRAHHWPGNARELRNVLEHALWLAAGNVLTRCEVEAAMSHGPCPTAAAASHTAHGRDRLYAELEANRWNRTQTARRLGIGRTTLWRWLRSEPAGPPE